MKRILLSVCCFSFFMLQKQDLHAQQNVNTLPTYKVAIFAPLFLDSVFNSADNYKYGKKFPKFIMPGLEFVQGAQLALDSLPLIYGNIQAEIFDSKSQTNSIASLLESGKLDSFRLIIGSVKDEEVKTLSAFSRERKIPFISATFPNDAGVNQNPYMVIVNSTLKSHCEAIYNFVLQNHGTDKILLVRRPGSQEDVIEQYFKGFNSRSGKPLLNIEVVKVSEDFNALRAKLDSNRSHIVIGGSLNEKFAVALTTTAYSLNKKYPVTLVGMPNWDGFTTLSKKSSFAGFPIYYTSPYYNFKYDNFSKNLIARYQQKYKSFPSDMAYKGYETVFLFSRLLTRYPPDMMNRLNDYAYKVFTDYNFKPVYLNDQNALPDYYENKHLYFLKMLNGSFSRAW